MKGDKEMAAVLDHRELNINLPDDFSLELVWGMVSLKGPDGKILDVVIYSELPKRKKELERLARQYKD